MKIVLASGWPGPEAEPMLKNMHITEPLMSFYYAKKDLNLFKKYKKKLYLDSGVFTARKKGKDININDLITYTRNNQENIQYVFGGTTAKYIAFSCLRSKQARGGADGFKHYT